MLPSEKPGLVATFGAEAVFSVLTYSSCSISMVLLNKLVTSPKKHAFNFPIMLIFCQNSVAVVCVFAAKAVGLCDFPGLRTDYVLRWLPLTLIFTGMLVSSLISLRTMSVACVTLIKAFAIIGTGLGDHILFGNPLTSLTVAAFALMYVGSCLGGGTDAWITAEGLFWSVINVLCTSGYQLYMKGVVNDLKKQLGRWGPVYYNNFLSLPPLLLPTAFTCVGPNGWLTALGNSDWWARFWIGTMCLLAPVLTMSTFWCISATSPTTYAVTGGMNKIPLAFLGMLIFNQWPDSVGFSGLIIGFSGGFVYTYGVQRKDPTISRASLARVGCLLFLFTGCFFVVLVAYKEAQRRRTGLMGEVARLLGDPLGYAPDAGAATAGRPRP